MKTLFRELTYLMMLSLLLIWQLEITDAHENDKKCFEELMSNVRRNPVKPTGFGRISLKINQRYYSVRPPSPPYIEDTKTDDVTMSQGQTISLIYTAKSTEAQKFNPRELFLYFDGERLHGAIALYWHQYLFGDSEGWRNCTIWNLDVASGPPATYERFTEDAISVDTSVTLTYDELKIEILDPTLPHGLSKDLECADMIMPADPTRESASSGHSLTLRHFHRDIYYKEGFSKPESAVINETLVQEMRITLRENEIQVLEFNYPHQVSFFPNENPRNLTLRLNPDQTVTAAIGYQQEIAPTSGKDEVKWNCSNHVYPLSELNGQQIYFFYHYYYILQEYFDYIELSSNAVSISKSLVAIGMSTLAPLLLN